MKCEGWYGPCDRQDAVKYRMRTAYVDDKKNFCILCPDCQEVCDKHWNDEWNEYYRGLL